MNKPFARKSSGGCAPSHYIAKKHNIANLKELKNSPLTIENVECFNENCNSVVLILSSSVVVRCRECESFLCLKCRSIECETLCDSSSSEISDDEMRPNIQQVVAEVHEEPKQGISKKQLFPIKDSNEADNEGSDPPVPIEESSESQTDTQSQKLEPLEEPEPAKIESPVISKPMTVASKTAEPVSSKAL